MWDRGYTLSLFVYSEWLWLLINHFHLIKQIYLVWLKKQSFTDQASLRIILMKISKDWKIKSENLFQPTCAKNNSKG